MFIPDCALLHPGYGTLGACAQPVVGTAEQVAEKLKRFYELGMDGVLMVFLSL